jgi:hypothetical protein
MGKLLACASGRSNTLEDETAGLLLRFGLGIVWFIISRIHAVPPSHAAVRWGVYFLSIVSLSVSGTIAWYAYNITLPKVMKSQNSREV